MPNSWDVPPPPTKGDDSHDITYASVGRALSQWEAFEVWFAHTFGAMMGTDGPVVLAAARAYGSVLTFRGRTEMLQAAAEVFFHSYPDAALEAELKTLINRASKFAARRNEIAHGIVLDYAIFSPHGDKEGVCLGPPAHATNKQELYGERPEFRFVRPKYIYAAEQIDALGDKFGDLTPVAQKLFQAIVKRRHS